MTKFLYSFLALLFAATGMMMVLPPPASASVNYNRLIDDFVFSSSNRMSADQIDAFLNSFSSSCISTNKGFKAPDPTGYNPTDGFLYGGNVSAGKVIYDAAQAYDLNPQVLLTTIQKEQSYVSGPGTYNCTDPLSSSARKGYTQIMGYGCPDGGSSYSYSGLNLYTIGSTTVTSVTGTCVNSASKAGFSQQVIRAAWLLKFGQQRSVGNTSWAIIRGSWDNSDDPGTCYGGPMTQGYRKRCSSDPSATYYDGYTTIDGSSVHMDTGATAALYWYTPHKNGNLNFFNIYSGWFGDPTVDRSLDIPLVGDWDGDGDDTIGVKHGNQYLLDNDNDGFADETFYYGGGAEIPLVGDWDGDGDDTIGLRYGTKVFINNELDNSSAFRYFYGLSDDLPLVGDWDADGDDTVSRRTGHKVFINNDLDSYSEFAYSYGFYDYRPIVGDFDGNGVDTVGLRINQKFFINNLFDSYSDFAYVYGSTSDVPIVGDFDGNNTDTAGLKINYKFFINNGFDGTSDYRIIFL